MKLRLVMLLCLCGLCGPPAVCAMEAADQLQLADGLFARGLHDMAVREYLLVLAAVTNHPRGDEINFRIAESYREMRNRIAAEKFYWTVELNYPASIYRFRAALRRAEMLQEEKKTDEVLAILHAALEAGPPRDLAAAALYMLASAQMGAGNAAEAGKALARIAADYGASPYYAYAALTLAGMRADETNGAAQAAALYQAAASNAPTARVGAEAWFQLADLRYRSRDFAGSAEAYAQLYRLYPADSRAAEARLPRAWAVYSAGMTADALRLAEDGLAGGGTNAPAAAEWLYLKANCQRQLMKFGEAAQTYAALLAQAPKDPGAEAAAYERTLSLYQAGAFRDAIQCAQPLLANPANRKDVYWLMAESHAALKEEDQAIQYYRLLTEQYPEASVAADASYRLARLLQKRGELLPAAELFDKLARARPSSEMAPQALFAAATCFSKAGRHAEAIRDWSALLQQYPQNSLAEEALFQKAMSETYLRRDEQAVATLRELIGRNAGGRFVAEARFWLGILLDMAGRSLDAEPELRAAMAAKPPAELDQRVRLQLAMVLQKNGKPDESAGLLQGLLNTPIRDRLTPALLEWLCEYQLGRKEAAPALETAALLVQRGSETNAWGQVGFCLMGRGLQVLGKTAEAQTAFEKALAAPAGNPETRAEASLRLGELKSNGTNTAAALPHFEEAAKLAADDKMLPIRVRAYAGIGKALKAQDDLAGASKYFMSVAVLFDDPELVPECLAEAAAAFKQLGRAEESAKASKELAERYPDSRWNPQKAK